MRKQPAHYILQSAGGTRLDSVKPSRQTRVPRAHIHETPSPHPIQNAPTDRPLCIFLPLLYPHPPYGVEEPYFSRIDRAKLHPADLRRDPTEIHNCIADPARADLARALRDRLLTFYLETADVVPHDRDRRG